LVFLVCFVAALQGAEVARVGDAVITSDSVRQTVARNGYNIYDEASVKRGLEDAVQFELLAAEAKRQGLDQEPVMARRIKELLVQQLLAEKVDGPLGTLHFSSEELRTYYDAHTNDFRRAALARGVVITVLIEPGKEAEAQAKARRALEELKDLQPSFATAVGNQKFKIENPGGAAAIVKKYSDDPGERLSGGVSDFFVEGQPGRRYPKEVEEAMLGLRRRGEVAGPVPTARALYLIRLTERRDAQLTAFEQARAEVQRRLVRERRQKLVAEFCEELKKDFPVTVNEPALKEAVQASQPSAGPPGVPGSTP
jgi:peptidyl-prolyl cis-trans isomerase C